MLPFTVNYPRYSSGVNRKTQFHVLFFRLFALLLARMCDVWPLTMAIIVFRQKLLLQATGSHQLEEELVSSHILAVDCSEEQVTVPLSCYPHILGNILANELMQLPTGLSVFITESLCQNKQRLLKSAKSELEALLCDKHYYELEETGWEKYIQINLHSNF